MSENKPQNPNIPNLVEYKLKRVFDYKPLTDEKAYRGAIGLPRALNMYENFPFWHTFFTCLGYKVVVSPISFPDTAEVSAAPISAPDAVSDCPTEPASASDAVSDCPTNPASAPDAELCFPAKLAYRHVQWLVNNGVKNIFFPCVAYERKETKYADDHRNCPIVTAFPEYIRNNLDAVSDVEITYLDPFVSFESETILTERLCDVFTRFDIPEYEIRMASLAGWKELGKAREDIRHKGEDALKYLRKGKRAGVVLAGNPYHTDPVLSCNTADKIAALGITVLTEDSISQLGKIERPGVPDSRMYSSRLYSAAAFAAGRRNLEMIVLRSDRCKIFASETEGIKSILAAARKKAYFIDISEDGTPDLTEIMPLLASLSDRKVSKIRNKFEFPTIRRVPFTREMRGSYTILCPALPPVHFSLINSFLSREGYNLEMLPVDASSCAGSAFQGNICSAYGNIIGSFISALQSGKYDINKTALLFPPLCYGCLSKDAPYLVRKALESAGLPQIPVIFPGGNSFEKNPGFKITFSLLRCGLEAMVYADLLTRLLCRTRPYEAEPGSVDALYRAWELKCINSLSTKNQLDYRRNIKKMVREFDSVPLNDETRRKRAGVTGEPFAGFFTADGLTVTEKLEKSGFEIVPTDILSYFAAGYLSGELSVKFFGKRQKNAKLARIKIDSINYYRRPAINALKKSNRFSYVPSIDELSGKAASVISCGNQSGRGWLTAGEAVNFLDEKVDGLFIVRPAGCLTDFISGKGLKNALTKRNPDISVTVIDTGSSDPVPENCTNSESSDPVPETTCNE